MIVAKSKKGQRGLTLIELIVAFTILMVLTAMAVPLARYKVRKEKEIELERALREIRKAIDNYKDASDAGKLSPPEMDTFGYPKSLEVLVEGVKMSGRWTRKSVSAANSQGPVHELHRLGQAQHAGRSGGTVLRRPECFRCSHQDYGEGARWHRIFRLVASPSAASRRRGFTLIELMIVMAIIAVLVSMALPIYEKSIVRSKESVLKNNLFTMRTVIDEYTYDKQKAPQNLDDLVNEGYLREVPSIPSPAPTRRGRS